MVVPNRDLRDIQISTSAFSSTTLQIDHLPASSAINIDFNKKVNNFNNIKRRSSSLNRVTLRSTSVISKISSIFYHKRMEIQNNFVVATTYHKDK